MAGQDQDDPARRAGADTLLSVVVPVYNSASSLEELVERLLSALSQVGEPYEIILVNDGSGDESWEVIHGLLGAHPALVGVDLLRNHGQNAATMCGMAQARGDLVATLDDDLQHPPEELPTLLEHLHHHPDVDAVVGSWPQDQGLVRNFGTRVNAVLDRLSNGTPGQFHHTGFRVMRRPVVDSMLEHHTRTPIVWTLLTRSTSRVENVRVRHDPRRHGRSGYTLSSATRLVLKNFLQGTTLPLRLLSVLGFVSAVLAFVFSGVVLARWAAGIATPPGWASSTLAVTFFGGMTLFGLGLIGEYLRLLMIEAREPPRWSVRAVRTSDRAGAGQGAGRDS